MNYIDCLILSNLSTFCYILSQTVLGYAMLLLARTIIITPIVILSLMLILKKCRSYVAKFCNCFHLFLIHTFEINTEGVTCTLYILFLIASPFQPDSGTFYLADPHVLHFSM